LDSRSRKPKPEGPIGRGQRTETERPDWQKRVQRDKPQEKSPLVPSEITPEDLDISVRVQLKTLTAENAEMVARHLAMVGLLIDDDPQLAHKHALAASRRAGRLAIVHETLGLTAYASGDFALAIRELQTDLLPLLTQRAVAHLGSALVCGTRGRRFKSGQPDSFFRKINPESRPFSLRLLGLDPETLGFI